MQDSSFGESVSTLQFGARVSEISLGAAKKNVESGALFEARELAKGAEGAAAHEQAKCRGAEARARTAEGQLDSANREIERLRVRKGFGRVLHQTQNCAISLVWQMGPKCLRDS